MNPNRPTVASQITFFYYHDLAPIAHFYEEVMGFERVEDQGWAKIYRVNGRAFMGIVDEKRGFHRAQERNAVLLTLVVDDVWAGTTISKARALKSPRSRRIRMRSRFSIFSSGIPAGM